MAKRLRFYIQHSLTDLRVNGQRTFFALLCIAAGVAAIVSLQTLAVMIQTTLTGNLQSSNRGDVVYQSGGGFGIRTSTDAMARGIESGILRQETTNFLGNEISSYFVSDEGYQRLSDWFEAEFPGQVTLTYKQSLSGQLEQFFGSGRGTMVTAPESGNSSPQAMAILIDPDVYPFYGSITLEDGRLLSEVMTAPTDIVLSDMIARNLDVQVGDTVTLNGTTTTFTVVGIVEAEQEIKNVAQDFLVGLFGFYYLDNEAISLFEDDPQARITTFYVQLADPSLLTEVDQAFQSEFPYFVGTDTEDLRENYTQLSESIDQLVTVMGLISLLIGSIGIVNTMQVIVRRRTLEIGVLKTLGLQANQITVLFMTEAFIMGVVGSLAGIVLGWGTTFLIRGTAEQLFATSLPFVLAPGPALVGLFVGVVVTVVFGFLPTLSAGLVRPNIVLRPSDDIVPRAGCLRLVLVIVFIIIMMALVTQGIVGSFSTALQVIGGAFFVAGIFYVMLWSLIWVIGRFFPSFGNIDLKISLRQMLAGRSRAAVTLLALVVGVFSLSLVTLMAESINNLLRVTLTEASGGNIAILASTPRQVTSIEAVLNDVDGVESYAVLNSYTLTLQGVQEGERLLTQEEIGQRMIDAGVGGRSTRNTIGPNGERIMEEISTPPDGMYSLLSSTVSTIDARRLDGLPERTFSAGRQLTADDIDTPGIVLSEHLFVSAAGIDVGDTLIFSLGNNAAADAPTFAFRVVGLAQRSFIGGGFEGQNYALIDAFPDGVNPNRTTIMANVNEDSLGELRRELSRLPGVFAIETAVITQLVSALLGAFIAFPTMVALLGLIVGGVVIANSVALTTMERRKEIAIMKSVGLHRERVLFMILLENGILGLIGGLIGVGIGLLGLVILLGSSSVPLDTIPWGTAFVLMLICVVVALVAALTSAWGASGEKPLNVLRYE